MNTKHETVLQTLVFKKTYLLNWRTTDNSKPFPHRWECTPCPPMTSNRHVQKPSSSLRGATLASPGPFNPGDQSDTSTESRELSAWRETSPKCKLLPFLLGYYEDIFVLYVADYSVPFFNFFFLAVSIVYDGDNKKRLLIGKPWKLVIIYKRKIY